ncbi:MFS transporter [Allomesorhizobium camelthorni]|uniref:MFS transporter n=1 Tax=Allomesorhizobium camelthorni TaxID=475069 RepID=A0A6G4WH14_9HYPH|nr:MFS transporter [Mesorhizobium camelthorni]NGO54095.1 MFS transporter [Mesorhizobium camelthorni]
MKPNNVIAALIAGVLIYGLAMGTTYPLLGVVLSHKVTGTLNGLNAGATGLGLLLGVLAMPSVSRRIGTGMTMLIGVATMATSLTALALTRDFWLIFAARLALGVGANFMFVIVETALNVFSPSDRRGRIMGLYSAAVAFGFVTGPAIVAAAPDAPLPVLLGCAGVAALALLPLSRVRRPIDAEVRTAPARRMGSAVLAFPFPFAILFIASAIDAVAISLLPIITLDQGFPITEGALFVTVFHIGLLAGQPLVGTALDVVGRQRTVVVCCALSLACTLLLAFSGQFTFWAAAGIMFVWGGANYGLYTAGLALIGDRFTGESLTIATAAFAAVYAVASTFAPLTAGSATDLIGATGFYLLIAGIYLAAVLVGSIAFQPLEPTV